MEKIKSRVQEARTEVSRVANERPKVWLPPERLGEMLESFGKFLPDFHLRWVRRELRGDQTDGNVLRRIREGYEVVKPEEVQATEVRLAEDGKYVGAIISGDLMLMKQHKDITRQRSKHYNEKARAQQRAVDAQMDENQNSLMPMSRSIKVHTSTGRPRQIIQDE